MESLVSRGIVGSQPNGTAQFRNLQNTIFCQDLEEKKSYNASEEDHQVELREDDDELLRIPS